MRRADEVFIVSGLPRSGTSMMMRMLKAGGVPLVEDGVRVADDDNPHGYFELEAVRALRDKHEWLAQAKGRVVKVVSQLLFDLPDTYEYRIVFMRRHIDEILASQRQMLIRSGQAAPTGDDAEIRLLSIRHLNEVIDWLASRSNMKVLYVNYGRAGEPRTIGQIAELFDLDLDRAAMQAAIDTSLYRNRHGQAPPR